MKLLFIHGAGAWEGIWWKQLEFFTDADSVILPGHPDGTLLTNIEDYGRWLHDYIESRHYQDIILVGYCMGGAIAISYILTYPKKVRGLVLSSPGADPDSESAHMAELEEAVRGEISGWVRRLRENYGNLSPDERAYIVGRCREIGPLAQLSDTLCCHRFNVNGRLANINVPTLIICGKKDTTPPPERSEYLAKLIPGAKKETIKGAANQIFLEKPAEFNQIVSNFVSRLSQ